MAASPSAGSGVDISLKWASATLTPYTVVKPGTVAMSGDLAADASTYPIGILQDVAAQNGAASVRISGVSYGIASAAISVGARVAATTDGKLVTYAKKATYPTNITYTVGTALTASAADGDLITIVVSPCEADAT